MAGKVKYPLKMADGANVRNIEELREHFELITVLEYYNNGRLIDWLRSRYYDEEADAVSKLDPSSADLKKDLCSILGTVYSEDEASKVNLDNIAQKNERREILKKYTADDTILAAVDRVAFTQEDLTDLLNNNFKEIYLCGEQFSIPANIENITYIGVNEPVVKFYGESVGSGIDLQRVKFNISEYIEDCVDYCIDHFDVECGIQTADGDPNMRYFSFFYNNSALGIKLLHIGAEQESVRAYTMLGICYLAGFGVDKDYEDAIKWFEKAAKQNYIRAQFMLWYIHIYVVYSNRREGLKWLEKAAEQGYARAQYQLGEEYFYGNYLSDI